jgi:hypothetical protein
MNHIINYIKDILEDDDINVEIKDGKYIITKTYDAKYSGARDALFSMIKLSDKTKIESKLKTYLPETTFIYYIEILNPPKPVLRFKKPSDFYGELYGGLDMANSADSYVTIPIPNEVGGWDYGCYTI